MNFYVTTCTNGYIVQQADDVSRQCFVSMSEAHVFKTPADLAKFFERQKAEAKRGSR